GIPIRTGTRRAAGSSRRRAGPTASKARASSPTRPVSRGATMPPSRNPAPNARSTSTANRSRSRVRSPRWISRASSARDPAAARAEPLRILRLVEFYDRGAADGHGSYVTAAARALVGRGHEVHVLACAQNRSVQDTIEAGVHVHRRAGAQVALDSPVLQKATNRYYQVVAHMLEHERLGTRFDVIESPDFKASGLLVAA